jgi:hypothetical protein
MDATFIPIVGCDTSATMVMRRSVFVRAGDTGPHRRHRKGGGKYLGELTPFYLKRFWRPAAQIRRLRKFLRKEKIDVLHSHFVGVNSGTARCRAFIRQ